MQAVRSPASGPPPGVTRVWIRVLVDAVVGGAAAIVGGIGVVSCVTRDDFGASEAWSLVFTGLIFTASVALLFSRSASARRLAIVAFVLSIGQVVATMVYGGWVLGCPSESLRWLSLLTAPPAGLLALLVVDHYLVTRQGVADPLAPPPLGQRLRRVAKLLGCGAALMANVALIAWLAPPLATKLRSSAWETAEATVLNSDIIPRGDEGPAWVDVAYAFEVDGVRHAGDRWTTLPRGLFNYRDRDAARLAEHLPSGLRLPVVYDPSDPSRSLLQAGFAGVNLVFLLACCFYACCLFTLFEVLLVDEQNAFLCTTPKERLGVYFPVAWAVRQTIGSGVATFGVVSFLVAIAVLVATGGLPSFAWGLVAWGAAILISGVVCVGIFQKARREATGTPAC